MACELSGNKLAVGQMPNPDGGIKAAFDEVDDGVTVLRIKHQLRMLAHEGWQARRKPLTSHRRRQRDS
ncbi:hypothetical protein D3C85_1782070 [compost metagenome]